LLRLRARARRKIALSTLTSVLLVLLTFLPTVTVQTATSAQQKTGLIVPLYAYLGPTWTQIIQIHKEYPNVPILASINPNNGPGAFLDPNLLAGVQSLQNAGIMVLGYTSTGYGDRSLNSVEAASMTYWKWYHVDGMIYDQVPNWDYNSPNGSWYYKGPDGTYLPQYFANLMSFDKSLGMTLSVENPGTDVPSNFVGTADIIVIYESPGAPLLSFLDGWHVNSPKSNFAIIAYNVSPYNQSYVEKASQYLGYIFLTDGAYIGALPSYLNDILTTLSAIDG
jgi:Spherulation-specific family 4